MNELSIFSQEEQTLLTSVIYKVGVWISHVDDEEGEDDDQKEMKALAVCIRAVARKYDGPGLVDDLARAVLASQDLWEEWTDYSFNVLPECKKAIALMRTHGTKQDLKNYKMALMEVGTIVAQAHGEFGQYEDEDEGSIFGALLNKITSGFSALSTEDRNHPMNVSAAESSALSELKALLKEL